jgi:uncharacterized protein DUF4231
LEDPTLDRLEDQISWYDRKSSYNQTAFKSLKVLTIASAAVIPVLSFFPDLRWITAAVGVVIAVSEGIQQINQYNANWISYRSTCEALKHEKFLYLATAGPYGTAANAHTLLAERIESLVSQEHAKWASSQEEKVKSKEKTAAMRGQDRRDH